MNDKRAVHLNSDGLQNTIVKIYLSLGTSATGRDWEDDDTYLINSAVFCSDSCKDVLERQRYQNEADDLGQAPPTVCSAPGVPRVRLAAVWFVLGQTTRDRYG